MNIGKLPPLTDLFKAARRASTPIIAVRASDQAEIIKLLSESVDQKKYPILFWDCVKGLQSVNDLGEATIEKVLPDPKKPAWAQTARPSDALDVISKVPSGSIVFMKNWHNTLPDAVSRQALYNLRDLYKPNKRTVVLLGPDFRFPPDIVNDVVILDDVLPEAQQIETMIRDLHDDVGATIPAEPKLAKMVDALLGLPMFPAEQAAAMSLRAIEDKKAVGGITGVMDEGQLWSRKASAIEQIPGLSIYRGQEKFEDIGGCGNVKEFLSLFLNGMEKPRGVIFIDEIEKMMPGNSDSSGVSQAIHGTMLKSMQDNEANGLIFVGPPGAAKSAMAKAAGNEASIPTIEFDLNGMKDSLVGATEANLRQALKMVNGMTKGRALWIATSNNIAGLSPELKRRFNLGTFFFPLPSKEEREVIWSIYIKKYGLSETQEGIKDENWTGADIKTCCRNSYLMQVPLARAARFMVPAAVSSRDKIAKLYDEADGQYVSAAHDGYFKKESANVEALPKLRDLKELMEGD